MKKVCLSIMVVLVVGCVWMLSGCSGDSDAAMTTQGVGNEMPSGPHYNLNIIGCKNSKDVGNSDGHTLFVPLNGHCKIIMSQNQDGTFEVTDRDGTDGCASFNIGDSNLGDARTHYDVFARGLGKPNGSVRIIPDATFTDENASPLFELGDVTINRSKGKPVTKDISGLFYCTVTILADGQTYEYNKEWVFDIPYLLEYWWDYYNSYMKLLQVRFYEAAIG